jgi:hypothetical protein
MLVPLACCLEKKPGSSLGFIDPNFDQARRGKVTMLVAHVMCFAKVCGQRFVVVGQLGDHVQGLDIFRIVIEHALIAGNVTDRSQRKSANLADSLCDWISHREKLVGVLVEKQMVIAEVRATHVPVEIFGFQIEREHVGQNGVHCRCDVPGRRSCEVGRSFQRRVTPLQKFYGFSRGSFFHNLTVDVSIVVVF